MELIVSLTDYDRIGGSERGLCNCYGFLHVGRHFGRQSRSFSVIGWTVVAMALDDMRWRI